MPDKAICILGIHRSGTSMMSRGVNLLGAWLGEGDQLMGPAPDNQAGFWERWDLMNFHDKVLRSLGRTWEDHTPMPADWFSRPAAQSFAHDLGNLVDSIYGDQPLWAFKDPRVCLLLPMWKEVLDKRGIPLSMVFVVRNPLDVAQSLRMRNGFTQEKSFALWETCCLQVLKDARDTPLIVAHYRAVMDDPVSQFERIARALDLSASKTDCEIAAKCIRKDLVHHDSTIRDLQLAEPPESVLKLYEAMVAASRLPGLYECGYVP